MSGRIGAEMSEAMSNGIIFEVGVGSPDYFYSWRDKGGHEVAYVTEEGIMCVEPEGKMHCTGKMTAAPAATPTHVQCADLAAHVECRKELLALQAIDQGRAPDNFVSVLVFGLVGMALLVIIFMWLGRRRGNKGLRTTTDAQPGVPIIRVELPGVVRER